MSKKEIIKKALILNDVFENDVIVIKTDITTSFSVHLLSILVSLLYEFAVINDINEQNIYNFIVNNAKDILNIVCTELEIALFNFNNYCQEYSNDKIELNIRDETMLFMLVKCMVSNELKEIYNK